MKCFFDTEFTNLSPNVEPGLISVGLVSEGGESEFYAELNDFRLEDCSDFVHGVVLPLLDGGECLMTWNELKERLRAWLQSFGAPVKLVCDAGHDWMWIQELFYDDWPSNLDGRPLMLNLNSFNDADKYYDAVERAFTKGGLRRHHALDDARANRLGWIAGGGDC